MAEKMSSVFSITDVEFDDLEDEEFLNEACIFGSSQRGNNLHKTNLKANEHDFSKNSIFEVTKLNCLRSIGSTRKANDGVDLRYPSATLRSSSANSASVITNNGEFKCDNSKCHEVPSEDLSCEHPAKKRSCFDRECLPTLTKEKRLKRTINGVNALYHCGNTFEDSDEWHDKDSTTTEFHNLSGSNSRGIYNDGSSSRGIQNDGLRYTQNRTFMVHSSNSNTISSSCLGLLEKKLPEKAECSQYFTTNLDTRSMSVQSNDRVCYSTPSRLNGNKNLKTASLQSKCVAFSADNNNLIKNTNSDSCLAETPNRLCRKPLTKDVKCLTPKTRRFPGPAGILPRLEPGQNVDGLASPLIETPKKRSPEACQMINHENDEEFSTKPWTVMQSEISKRFPAPVDSLASVLRKAASQELEKGKVAVLGVLVKSFRPSGFDVSVVLKDPSGEMRGTLHHKVLEEHQTELGPGCGLLLKQVSVFSPSPRKHYLNITPGNIVEIFPVSGTILNSYTKSCESKPISPKEIICPPVPVFEQQTTDGRLYQESFDALLEGLDADDDILIEAMNF